MTQETNASLPPPTLTPRASIAYAFNTGGGGIMVLRCPDCNVGMLADEAAEHPKHCARPAEIVPTEGADHG